MASVYRDMDHLVGAQSGQMAGQFARIGRPGREGKVGHRKNRPMIDSMGRGVGWLLLLHGFLPRLDVAPGERTLRNEIEWAGR